jgi:hypothetical protein
MPGFRSKRSQWRHHSEKILMTEDLEQLPIYYTSPVWGYAAFLTRRHGQAVSKKTGVMMGINVSAVFMDGHVQPVDEDFTKDIKQIHLED